MTCPVCKCENADGERICAVCGAQIPERPAGKAPAQVIPAKRPKIPVPRATLLLIAAAAVLVVLLIGVTAALSGSGGDYTYVKQSVVHFENKDGDRYTVFVNGEAVGQPIPGIGDAFLSYPNIDHSITLFHLYDGSDNSKSVYYILRGKNLAKVEGSEEWISPVMASSGKGIAYTVEDGDECSLYLYNVGSRRSTKVDTAEIISQISVSPDGESLTYVAYNSYGEEDYSLNPLEATAYLFDGKQKEKLGEFIFPIGLSNGGKYIYASSGSEDGSSTTLELYSQSGEKLRTIGKNTGYRILFNEDHTQVLYVSDEDTYISVNGKPGTRFLKNSGSMIPAMPVLPNGVSSFYDQGPVSSTTYPVDSFYNKLFYNVEGDTSMYLVKKNVEQNVKLASDFSDYALNEDGSRIYFLDKDENLKMIKTAWGKKGSEKAVTIASDVDEFVVTPDGSRVYYLDDHELYSAKGSNGKSRKKIADNVAYEALDGMYRSLMLGKGDILYFEMLSEEGNYSLYACSNGKSAELVLDNPGRIGNLHLGYIYIRSGDEVYCTTGAKKLKKVYTVN